MVKDISELRYLNTGPISNVGCATFSLLAAVKHRSGVRPSVCLFRVFSLRLMGAACCWSVVVLLYGIRIFFLTLMRRVYPNWLIRWQQRRWQRIRFGLKYGDRHRRMFVVNICHWTHVDVLWGVNAYAWIFLAELTRWVLFVVRKVLTDDGALKGAKQSTGSDVTHGANLDQWLAVEHLELSPWTQIYDIQIYLVQRQRDMVTYSKWRCNCYVGGQCERLYESYSKLTFIKRSHGR